MDEKIIEGIIREVFKKAEKEHPSHSKFALSNHISSETDLSSRTLERLYDGYISKKKKHGIPNAESIDMLCRYLKYEDYKHYVEDNLEEDSPENRSVKWKSIITITLAFSVVLSIFWVLRNQLFTNDDDLTSDIENVYDSKKNNSDNDFSEKTCMTWADSEYIKVSCDMGPLSKYGTEVKPMRVVEFKNMKKVKVTASYNFFTEDGKPLIWYYKNRNKEIEYFTSPGLHPTNGETLRKITPHIIETYVPIHLDLKESFTKEQNYH